MNRRLFPSLFLSTFLFSALAFLSLHDWTSVHASSSRLKSPTEGSLLAVNESGDITGQCPLKHTDVKAEVSGFISRVTVTQEFENPFEDKIEAVYSFPLPQSAAVDSMTMLVGERTIKGVIMRREEAQAAYQAAKEKGQTAALLDQERPNIFTQSVANIQPGHQIKVVISYVETLNYEEGSYEWSFPMTVGPRYNPGQDKEEPQPPTVITDGPETRSDSAPDSSRRYPRVVSGEERPGSDISIEVVLDAGVPIDNLNSLTHEIEVERTDERRVTLRLKKNETIPNKDFIFKYDVAGQKIEDAVLTHRSTQGGFFTMILQPPERVTVEDVMPKELVFVLDTSGSMQGFPLEKAKETMKLALDGLYPQDTFNLITFSGDTRILFSAPVQATPENLKKAQKFLADQKSDGGTEMMKAIRAALKPSESQSHLRIACFMTDGQVGNDMEILDAVKKYSNARVFAMGFGYSPNRYLLDKMAQLGRGEVEYVTETADSTKTARRFHERVRDPLLTDLSVEWGGITVTDIYPKLIPDLFSAKPVILSGRYSAGGRGLVRLKGKMSGREFVREIAVEFPDNEPRHDVLAKLWARRKIDDLMEQDLSGIQNGKESKELREAITGLGLEFKLMTQFTSFVAVEGDTALAPVAVTARDTGNLPFNSLNPVMLQPGTAAANSYGSGTPGGVSASVTVVAGPSMMNTTSSELSSTMERNALQDLPLRGRSLQTIVELPPGTVSSATWEPATASPYKLSVTGQRTASNYFTVDGLSANVWIAPGGQDAGASAAGTLPGMNAIGGTNSLATVDAVQEVTIRTFAIAPETGRVPGGEVDMRTRSGTNEFHGSLFEYFGNDALDANDWFANSRSLGKPARKLNDFGGTFGGPLKKDKTFFFAAYEGLRLRQPAFALTDVPSVSLRTLAPAALQPFLNAYPVPNGAERGDGFALFAGSYSNPARMDAGSFRLDQVLNNQFYATARYNYASSSAEERGLYGSSLNTLNRRRSRLQTLSGRASYTFSPETVGEVLANYSRFTSGSAFNLDNFGGANVSNGAGLFTSFFAGRADAAAFDLQGRNSILMTGSERTSVQRQFNILGVVTTIKGNHMLKFGADYRRVAPVIALRPLEQSVLFNGAQEALTTEATRIGVYTRAPLQRPVFNNFSAYAQDEWRITPRLNVTYGVRWDVNPSPIAAEGPLPPAVTQIEDLSQLGIAPDGTRLWQTTYGNFAPRVGVAYELSTRSGLESVVRGGYGLFYDLGTQPAGHVFADSFPTLTGRTLFNAPLQDVLTLPAGNTTPPATVPFTVFDPRLKLPYTSKWYASYEQQFGPTKIAASYVGAAGRRLLLTESLFDRNADFPFIRLTTNNAKSDYHAFHLQYLQRLSWGLQAMVSYTLSKSTDDYSQDSAQLTLLRGDDARMERGPSDFDVRHVLAGSVSYELPAPFEEGLGNSLTRNWVLMGLFNARSARPLNVVYSFPTTYGTASLRPDVNDGVPLYLFDTQTPGGRRINPAAFSVPATIRQGNLGRNSLRVLPLYQLDMALQRQFNFTDSFALQVRMEAFNLFNSPTFEDPLGTDLSLGTRSSVIDPLRLNTTFGQSASMYGRSLWGGPGSSFSSFYNPGGPRSFQFSLKLKF